MVKLTSPQYSGLTLLLTPTRERRNEIGGKEIIEQGKKVQFRNHIAEVPDDWMPLIESHPAYTGANGHERTVMLWSDVIGTGTDTGVRVVHGAVGASGRKAEAPHPDWDTMTPKSIGELIEAWPNQRIEQALYWELDRRRRKGILRVITDRLAPEPENPQPIIAEEKAAIQKAKDDAIKAGQGSGPIAQSFEAPLPEGQDGI